MRRGDLADLTAFVTVAEKRSFCSAAERLGVTPSAMSHTITQLEQRLGVRLLQRSTRGVSLTDAGTRLLERLRPAMDQIAGALEDLDDERKRPSGRLRIYATTIAASEVVAPIWAQFLTAYPQVQLELELGYSAVDIVTRGFDAGIGPRDHAAADMIAIRVAEPKAVVVVGAPAYFAARPAPAMPDDLAQHSCIQYRWGSDRSIRKWAFECDGESRSVCVAGPLIVNGADFAVLAAVDGVGIAYVPEALAAPYVRSGRLIRVLEPWCPHNDALFLHYSGRRQVPAALRALIDMIRVAPAGQASPLRRREAAPEAQQAGIQASWIPGAAQRAAPE
jgi:DNA-binding transcriptional LysR family regulator